MHGNSQTHETVQMPWPPRLANRRYKDTVFRDLFGTEENKANALELYNALAGTSFDDPSVLELTTLDDVIYMNVKNDVSFLVGDTMMLWEHQSSANPNMPLRGLVYFARLYAGLVADRWDEVYGSERLNLPTPRFIVFYNGTGDAPASEVFRLSDSFSQEGDVEVRATVLNVNLGRSPDLEQDSPTLAGYAFLVSRIREYNKVVGIDQAVDLAVQECIETGVLADYLTRKRAEVMDMFMTEWDEEHERLFRERMREKGYREGHEQGYEDGTKQGYQEGHKQGIEDGTKQGYQEGIEQGIEQERERIVAKMAELGVEQDVIDQIMASR